MMNAEDEMERIEKKGKKNFTYNFAKVSKSRNRKSNRTFRVFLMLVALNVVTNLDY